MVVLMLFAGAAMVLYPWISNKAYENRADDIIEVAEEQAGHMGEDRIEKLLGYADSYNSQLYESGTFNLSDPFKVQEHDEVQSLSYRELLSMGQEGIMGSIEIPAIDVKLPIYHGTDAETLKKGVGHMEGTSLPIGGENTHSVLTGHTGLSSARMFSDLELLKEGDQFLIKVVGDTLAYKVCNIQVVLPYAVDSLYIQKGKDLVTLITCTPYGINDHRLLVTGERTAYQPAKVQSAYVYPETDSQWMKDYRSSLMKGALAGGILLVLLLLIGQIQNRKKNKKGNRILWGTLSLSFVGIVIGLGLIFYADIRTYLIEQETMKQISMFEQAKEKMDNAVNQKYSMELPEEIEKPAWDGDFVSDMDPSWLEDPLYQEILTYNETIYQNEQEYFDEDTVDDVVIRDARLPDDIFGYIEIPVLKKKFTLYLGASDEHLAKGLAVMGQTSLPVGGVNTNSVIAGHRGWNTGNFLRDIEELGKGDHILITNPWTTLSYEVTEIDIVPPDASQRLLIQRDKELITLLTCHPYLSHGKNRYLVFARPCDCGRKKIDKMDGAKNGSTIPETIRASDGTVYESSSEDIRKEQIFRRVVSGIVAVLAMFTLIRLVQYRKQNKNVLEPSTDSNDRRKEESHD